MKVAILYGEVSKEAREDEKDVLVEVEAVSKSLYNLGYDPVALPLSMNIKKTIDKLKQCGYLFVFNLIESIEGKDQFIHIAPTVLDSLKIPYTGSKSDAIYITTNKLLAKKLLKAAHIPTPFSFTAENFLNNNIRSKGPWIIKSIWEHASIGLDENSVFFKKDLLKKEIKKRFSEGERNYFVEDYIDGREFNISLLAGKDGPEVLPHAEIKFVDYNEKIKVVGYRAKWDESSFEYHHTIRSFDFPEEDSLLLDKLTKISKDCWDLFDLKGYGRVDFRVDLKGNPWVLEVNINPCLSPDSGFIAATVKAGLSYEEVIKRIIGER